MQQRRGHLSAKGLACGRAPESEHVLLVVAAQLARDGKMEEATSLLASSSATGCALMRAQLAVEAGDAKQVCHFVCQLDPQRINTHMLSPRTNKETFMVQQAKTSLGKLEDVQMN